MKKEKVKYVKLPKGAEYQRVEVAEDGRICIIYTKECVDIKKNIKRRSRVSLPKPTALIGGTEVYQKDNGVPYWYCRIKGGRDEFMHLYFEDLTHDDLFYDAKGKFREAKTWRQKKFMIDVCKALKNKPQEGYRWIPVFRPLEDSEGNLCYDGAGEIMNGFMQNPMLWENMAKEYSPENGSKEASITTYFLLLLRWLKDGVATLEQLADNSNETGYSWNTIGVDGGDYFEKYADCEFGGLYGFVGTYKIVKDSEASSGFSIVAGYCYEWPKQYPLANVLHNCGNYSYFLFRHGLLELTK